MKRKNNMLASTIIFAVLAVVLLSIGYYRGEGQHLAGLKAGFSILIQILPLLVLAFVSILIIGNLLYYTPQRLYNLRGLYGMERADMEPFFTEQAQELAPALIVVHPKNWMEYGVLLDLQSPDLDSPFIFIFSHDRESDEALREDFPDRDFYHYYPSEPFVFYLSPKPSK